MKARCEMEHEILQFLFDTTDRLDAQVQAKMTLFQSLAKMYIHFCSIKEHSRKENDFCLQCSGHRYTSFNVCFI